MTYQASRDQSSRAARTVFGLDLDDLAELLFASSLQPSQSPTVGTVLQVLLEGFRPDGDALGACAAHLAGCYGDDPDATCERMRWARATVIAVFFREPVAA